MDGPRPPRGEVLRGQPLRLLQRGSGELCGSGGREFTERANEEVAKLENDIILRRFKNNQRIETLRRYQASTFGLMTRLLEKSIGRLEQENIKLEEVFDEILILTVSDQVYDIDHSNDYNTSESVNSISYYFEDTGVFMITLGNYSLGSLAHELKHAYQFEVGVLSSGHIINGFPFYDKSDELEAYRRGALFGIPFNGVLDKRYDQIQDGPCEVTSLNPDLYSSPVELHKYAQRHHTNFRYNGITYRYYKK